MARKSTAKKADQQPAIDEAVVVIAPTFPSDIKEGKAKIVPLVLNDEQATMYADLTTTSAKIRYLHAEGFSRGQIALKTNKRYQHVRNVLITPLKRQLNANANANSKHAE